MGVRDSKLALKTKLLRIISPPTPEITVSKNIRLNPIILNKVWITIRYRILERRFRLQTPENDKDF